MESSLLLVSAGWRLRTLLRTQLLDHGYQVTAVSSWDEAELLLRTRALVPSCLVFDVEDEPHSEAALATLTRLVDPGRVLVLASALTLTEREAHRLGIADVVARPFRVQDVVAAVSRLVYPAPPPE